MAQPSTYSACKLGHGIARASQEYCHARLHSALSASAQVHTLCHERMRLQTVISSCCLALPADKAVASSILRRIVTIRVVCGSRGQEVCQAFIP